MARRAPPVEEKARAARERHAEATSLFDSLAAPPAADYMRTIEGVPTCFPHLDWKTGIGGLPVGRVVVVHGPSSEGKTKLCLGFLASYVDAGHYAALGDAEHTTPPEFAELVMGSAYRSERFRSIPIENYEQVRRDSRAFCERVHESRGEDSRLRSLFVLDSLKNLMPSTALEELAKSASGAKGRRKSHVDGYGGMLGMLQASYNTAWFVELSSLLPRTFATAVIVVREKVEESDNFYEDDKVEVVGGREVNYGNSLRLRVTSSTLVDDEKRMVGERHAVKILKTKIAGKSDAKPTAYFHTSNGAAAPEGLDRARDVFELAREEELGVITLAGSWYSVEGERFANGEKAALAKLRADPELLARVEASCRARFKIKRAS